MRTFCGSRGSTPPTFASVPELTELTSVPDGAFTFLASFERRLNYLHAPTRESFAPAVTCISPYPRLKYAAASLHFVILRIISHSADTTADCAAQHHFLLVSTAHKCNNSVLIYLMSLYSRWVNS